MTTAKIGKRTKDNFYKRKESNKPEKVLNFNNPVNTSLNPQYATKTHPYVNGKRETAKTYQTVEV